VGAAPLMGARNALSTPLPPGESQSDLRARFLTRTHRETTRLLRERLGDTTVRELRARGEAMDRDQACAFACTYIEEHLARNSQASS
jgi:hypothetical protein